MTCLHQEDRTALRGYDNEELLRVVKNHRTLAVFQSEQAWNWSVCTWPELCAYKSIVRNEARRRGLLGS